MLGVGRVPPPSAPPLSVKKTTTCNISTSFSLLCQCQPHKKHSFLYPELLHSHSSPPVIMKRTGFCLFAQKKQQNSSLSKIELKRQDFDGGLEVNEGDYDEFDEDLDVFDEIDDEEEDDDDEDDELLVPFDKMDAWLKKKPRGFGEGKEYDTSIEDKLLEELEKSRLAQVANVDKLKVEAKEPEPEKELKKEVKASEVAPGCVRVRINNLPKKRNIHRDLKAAFAGVRGITNILPMVSGTKKTRDPVCKGFAFVDFKSAEDANRFVQEFSGQNIGFGKMGKRIKCEMSKSRDMSNEASVYHENNSVSKSTLGVLEEEESQVGDIRLSDPQLDSWKDDAYDELEEDSDDEDVVVNLELLNSMEKGDIEGREARLLNQLSDSLPTKKKERKVGKKKPAVKKQPDNSMKVKIPGSAKRLKVHEKAKLADVFSRYGVRQEAVASKEM